MRARPWRCPPRPVAIDPATLATLDWLAEALVELDHRQRGEWGEPEAGEEP